MLSKLDKPLPMTPPELVEGFWPCYDWRVIEDKISRLRCLPLLHEDVIFEDKELKPYCGLANKALEMPLNPWRGIWLSS